MGIWSFTLRDVVWLTLNDISINLTYLQLDLLTSVCLSPSAPAPSPHALSLSFAFCHSARHNECGPVNISTLRHLCWSAACSFLLSFELQVVDIGCVFTSVWEWVLHVYFCMCRHCPLSLLVGVAFSLPISCFQSLQTARNHLKII